MKPLDRLIAEALAAHTAALADHETEKVVFDPHNDAIEGRIKEAAKKPTVIRPASPRKRERMASVEPPPQIARRQEIRSEQKRQDNAAKIAALTTAASLS